MEVLRYCEAMANQWNAFVATAINGVFLFDRRFMDYHADRFNDYSLVIVENGDWQAVMPGNVSELDGAKHWCSHAGLSYGALVYQKEMSQQRLNDCLSACMNHLRDNEISDMELKLVPDIYYQSVNKALDYAVYYAGFDLVRRDAATTIFLSDRKKIKKGRKACIAKARRLGVEVDYSEDFSGFIAVENANLQKKYAVNAVHSAEELTLLHKRFPDNIFLFLAYSDGVLLAGGLIFQTATVAHLQYFCSTEQGESLSAGDLVIEAILKHCVEHNIGIFDFGISTEQQGRYLNAGLLRYKESFGGVTTIADFYKKSFTSNSG